MTALDLNKQQAIGPDSKAIQKINFNRNLYANAIIFSLLKKPKKAF